MIKTAMCGATVFFFHLWIGLKACDAWSSGSPLLTMKIKPNDKQAERWKEITTGFKPFLIKILFIKQKKKKKKANTLGKLI